MDDKKPVTVDTEQPRANPDHGRGKTKTDDVLPPTTSEEEDRRRYTGEREGGKR